MNFFIFLVLLIWMFREGEFKSFIEEIGNLIIYMWLFNFFGIFIDNCFIWFFFNIFEFC